MDPRILTNTVLRLDQTVRTIQQAIHNLATAIAAVNAKTQRAGVNSPGALAAGASVDLTVTWPTPWPDAGYAVDPTIICGTAALGGLHATLKAGTKTTLDCTVTVINVGANPVATYALDVIGIRT